MPKAVRKEFSKLSERERNRFLLALHRLKTEGFNDWWNLCSLHGGGFQEHDPVAKAALFPAMRDYYNQRGLKSSKNPNGDAITEENWFYSWFCPHGSCLFQVWHRPYMVAFETLLQYYDPGSAEEKANNPLAAHYWGWDDKEKYPTVPDWANSPTISINGQLLENPLFHGTSYWHKVTQAKALGDKAAAEIQSKSIPDHPAYFTQRFINDYDYFMDGNYERADNLFDPRSFKYFTYAEVSSAHSPMNFDAVHGTVHAAVGGYIYRDKPGAKVKGSDDPSVTAMYAYQTGDMAQVVFASFDPIFYLHHSNVERLHYAWVERYREVNGVYPTDHDNLVQACNDTLPGADSDASVGASFTEPDGYKGDIRMEPFPRIGNTSYESLPWKVRNTDVSTFKEWVDNSQMTYTYDDWYLVCGKDVRVPRPPPASSPYDNKVLTVAISKLHGGGRLTVTVKAKGQKFTLSPVDVFSAHTVGEEDDTHCPACNAGHRNIYSWLLPDALRDITVDKIENIKGTFQSPEITTEVKVHKKTMKLSNLTPRIP